GRASGDGGLRAAREYASGRSSHGAGGLPMNELKGRRDFIKLLGFGGVVFASGLAGCANGLRKSGRQEDDFFFVQLSDTHWGFKGPPNPEAANTLRQAVQAVNALPRQ